MYGLKELLLKEQGRLGMLFYADIYQFEDEPHSEIEKISIMEGLPDSWT